MPYNKCSNAQHIITWPTVHYYVSEKMGWQLRGKAQLNRCDLNARLKAGKLSIWRSAVRRLFHTSGPQTENARFPNWVRARRTAAALVVEDMRWRLCESVVLNTCITELARQEGQRENNLDNSNTFWGPPYTVCDTMWMWFRPESIEVLTTLLTFLEQETVRVVVCGLLIFAAGKQGYFSYVF